MQLFVSIWNYSICHFSLLFATIQLLFATSCHHSRLTTRIRSCILDMDDLSHTIRDYSYYSRLCAIRFFQTSINTKPSFNTGEGTAQKLYSEKRALDIRLRLFGEEHRKTADSFHKVGVTQHSLGDYISVLEPKNHALDIRRKLFGENHSETANSYLSVGVTQHSVGDYNSALE